MLLRLSIAMKLLVLVTSSNLVNRKTAVLALYITIAIIWQKTQILLLLLSATNSLALNTLSILVLLKGEMLPHLLSLVTQPCQMALLLEIPPKLQRFCGLAAQFWVMLSFNTPPIQTSVTVSALSQIPSPMLPYP